MNVKTSLPVLWLPLVAYWTFLLVLQTNVEITKIDQIIPLILYLIVSFLLLLQFQLLLLNKREGFIVKFGTTYTLGSFLLISSFSILAYFTSTEWNSTYTCLSLITALVLNVVIAEVFSFVNYQISSRKTAWENTNKSLEDRQLEQSQLNSHERNLYLHYRNQWQIFIEDASIDYINIPELNEELKRIAKILEYSTFFRSKSSLDLLDKIRKCDDNSHLLVLLRRVK